MGSHKPYIHMFLFCICSAYILMPPHPPGPPLLDRLMRERERNPSISPLYFTSWRRAHKGRPLLKNPRMMCNSGYFRLRGH